MQLAADAARASESPPAASVVQRRHALAGHASQAVAPVEGWYSTRPQIGQTGAFSMDDAVPAGQGAQASPST